jgi:hypothetical protein
MLEANAYHLAAKMLNSLRQRKEPRAVWIVGGNVVQTPNTDLDVAQMLAKRAVLVGVFDGSMPSADLADAIIAADGG